MMSTPSTQWPSVLRVAWITGGIVATNPPGPEVQVCAGIPGKALCHLRISNYASLLDDLRKEGLPVLGVSFFVNPDELQGLSRPLFLTIDSSAGQLVSETHQKWRQIAHAAARGGQMIIFDVASRIALGLSHSQMRLFDLVTAYSNELRGYLHANEIRDYRAFKDTNSAEVYKSIHSLFWEMAVLRDTLAEFAAAFCFARPEIKRMSKLRRSLADHPVEDPLAKELLLATDQPTSGWLAKFTDYRNFFTHVAPMEQAAGVAFVVQDRRTIARSVSVPQIYCALPRDIDEPKRRRSKGLPFASLEELSASSARTRDRATEPDALDYLHACINQFGKLSSDLVQRSPIAPMPIQIQREDMIGEPRFIRRTTE